MLEPLQLSPFNVREVLTSSKATPCNTMEESDPFSKYPKITTRDEVEM